MDDYEDEIIDEMVNYPKKSKEDEYFITSLMERSFLSIYIKCYRLPKANKLVNINIPNKKFTNPKHQIIFDNIKMERDIFDVALNLDDVESIKELRELYLCKLPNDDSILLKSLKDEIQKLLENDWMEKREKIKELVQLGIYDDENTILLARIFDNLIRNVPKVRWE